MPAEIGRHEAKIEKAKHSASPALRKEATFAENAKHWNHKASSGLTST